LIILGSWTWHKTLLVVLIALCIIGIILALVFLIIGKKKNKKNNRPQQPAAGPKTTKSAVQKGISPNPEYSPVPTSV
jgi:mannose/fructose/N-acetylgalactosamine-specific phosphotransferase system component IIC